MTEPDAKRSPELAAPVCVRCGQPINQVVRTAFGLRGLPRLRQYRINEGMSQAELAHHAGTTQGQISKLERGVQFAQRRLARKLANVLGVTVDDLEEGLFEEDYGTVAGDIGRNTTHDNSGGDGDPAYQTG